jgi:hypothetical protein
MAILRFQLISIISLFLTACLDKESYPFPDTEVGRVNQVQVSISNPAPTSVQINNVTVSKSEFVPQIKTPFELKPNETKSFSVTFKPRTPSSVAARLVVTASKEFADFPKQNADIFGKGVVLGQGVPKLVLSQSQIDFAAVKVQSSASQVLTLTNSGTVPLTIQSLRSVAGQPFKISGLTLPLRLNALGSIQTTVEFSPLALQLYQSQFTFETNDAARTHALTVKGTGSDGRLEIQPDLRMVASP